MMNLEMAINEMVADVTVCVHAMKVVEMRKAAQDMGIKNVKKYRRPELSEKLIAAIVEVRKDALTKAYEEELKAQEQKENKKAAKATTKKEQKATGKRYKATKVEDGDVEELVNTILRATPAEIDAMDLYNVNRKVLIKVMKALHCKLWYRTYDKPTMVIKITAALGTKVEVEGN